MLYKYCAQNTIILFHTAGRCKRRVSVEFIIMEVVKNGLPRTADEHGDSLKKKRRFRSATRNKKVECNVCLQKIRSDTVKRHMKKHRDLYSLDENDIREEIKERKRQYENREERKRLVHDIARQEGAPLECIEDQTANPSLDDLEEAMRQDNEKYLENIELGKQVNTIICKGVAQEESLSKQRKDALILYRKQMPTRDMTNVDLRPWQQELMKMIATPTDRQIIWVQGIRGNEGKSWFQDYVASFYGYGRVVQLDLKMKTADVLHALAKRPLSSTDIFLFNEPRAMHIDLRNYGVLEAIKDGIAVSCKYNSDVLHFKIPNIVIVFSNKPPIMAQLSRDRWCVLVIRKSGLQNITDGLRKKQTIKIDNPNPKYTAGFDWDDERLEDWSL